MLKTLILLLLFATLIVSNANAQYIYISSDTQIVGVETSTYTTSKLEDILITFIHKPGYDDALHIPLIFLSRIQVFVNDILQFSSGGGIDVISYWSCSLINIQPASIVKVEVVFYLASPQVSPSPAAEIFVTSRHEHKPIYVDDYVNSSKPGYSILQNYPNPFNPSTNIKFNLPVDSDIILKVFNLLGENVATLADGFFPAGVHSLDFNGLNLPSGIYFYRIEAKGIDGRSFFETKSMILTK